MIELSISSSLINDQSKYQILKLFSDLGIEVQLTETHSLVKYEKSMDIEKGFTIQIYNYTDYSTFKKDIWEPLKNKFDLTCGHVVVGKEYMGCVLNWPGVFVKSNCPSF